MNEKIYDMIRKSGTSIKKDYKVFAQDKYGNWTTSLTGHGGYSGISEGELWAQHYYAGNGVSYRGYVNASRTLDFLSKAYSLDFETWYLREANNVWAWWAYNYIINIANAIRLEVSGLYVNDILLCTPSENDHHKISIRQDKVIVDDKTYMYPDGFRLSQAQSNEFSVHTTSIDVNAGGYSCRGNLRVYIKDMNMKFFN